MPKCSFLRGQVPQNVLHRGDAALAPNADSKPKKIGAGDRRITDLTPLWPFAYPPSLGDTVCGASRSPASLHDIFRLCAGFQESGEIAPCNGKVTCKTSSRSI